MKKTLLILGVLTLSLMGCQEKKADLNTEEDKVFYTVGFMFGQRLSSLELSENEVASLVQGVRDSVNNKKEAVDLNTYQPKIGEVFRERTQKASKKFKEKGAKYLENFLKEEGAKQTESGLAYKIIEEGSGEKPEPTDVVEVHYHGTLTDGTVFDSSKERGKPVKFPLNRVIKGWTEGLQLIGEGGKIKLVIPAKLAYGEGGAPPKIPGGATLVFDVELLDIVDQEAAQNQGGGQKKK